MIDINKLPGSYKVAVLIQAVGMESAQGIIGALSPSEKELISGHLADMGPVNPELVEQIAREFAKMNQRNKNAKPGRLQTPGGEATKATSAVKGQSSKLTALRSIPPEQMVELIRDEHPQTIAIVIAHLNSDVASTVLSRLPDDLKVDVAFRIANLDKIIAGMVEEIESVFEEILNNKKTSETYQTGGVKQLAEILNQTDEATGELILAEIEENDPELAIQIKQGMFVFEDLTLVDDKGLQKVLRKVETGELAVALKGASEEVRDKIFGNMSERAGIMLREEIEALGAVRMKEVEDSQQVITRIIQDMEAKGDLIISGRRGEEFIA